jgi:putative acetyltransferase
MSAIQVRAYEPDDVEAFHAIHSHPDVVRDILQPPFISLHERRAAIEPTPSERYLTAELDGRIAGFGDLRLFQGRRRHTGHIGLAVDPACWGQGVGSALMQGMIELGERWYGLRRFELKVFEDNHRAVALYTRFGFEIEATHVDFALREGEIVTALSMARLLKGSGDD